MNFLMEMRNKFKGFGILKVALSVDNKDFSELYKEHIKKHNASILTDPFPNSGFDLFFPKNTMIPVGPKCEMVSMNVRCEMTNEDGTNIPYFMFPRSSFSKTPLILANHTGIIDSGYRGDLIGAFRNLDTEPYQVEKNTRLLQVCHPYLSPLYVVLVDVSELSNTSRGEGGFGSTGK